MKTMLTSFWVQDKRAAEQQSKLLGHWGGEFRRKILSDLQKRIKFLTGIQSKAGERARHPQPYAFSRTISSTSSYLFATGFVYSATTTAASCIFHWICIRNSRDTVTSTITPSPGFPIWTTSPGDMSGTAAKGSVKDMADFPCCSGYQRHQAGVFFDTSNQEL